MNRTYARPALSVASTWLLSAPLALAPAVAWAAETCLPDSRPAVKAVSPPRVGYLAPAAGQDRLLVTIEVTDTGNCGLETAESGLPRFHERDANVDLFLDHVVSSSRYTNHYSETVVQIVADLPVNRLVLKQGERVTPPFKDHLPVGSEEEPVDIPDEAMLEFAELRFQVRNARGLTSPATGPERRTLSLGFLKPTPAPAAAAE